MPQCRCGLPPRQPAVTSTACCDLDLDLQNLIRSSVGASKCSLKVSLRPLKPFMRYCDDMIFSGEQRNKWTDKHGRWTAQKHNVFTDTVGW